MFHDLVFCRENCTNSDIISRKMLISKNVTNSIAML